MRIIATQINVIRLVTLLLAAYVLGWVSYRQFADFRDPTTLYVIPSADAGIWLDGEWTVANLAGVTHYPQIEMSEAQALVGTVVKIHRHAFSFDDLSCPTEFRMSVEKPLSFLKNYGTTPFLLHMHMPNTRIDAGCADLYPLAQDMIFISYDGYFLEAVRKSTAR